MVLKESLNNDLIVAGKALIEKLLERGEAVPPAIWMYLDEPNSWRLIIGVPIVKTNGPRDGYKLIQKMFTLLNGQYIDDAYVYNLD